MECNVIHYEWIQFTYTLIYLNIIMVGLSRFIWDGWCGFKNHGCAKMIGACTCLPDHRDVGNCGTPFFRSGSPAWSSNLPIVLVYYYHILFMNERFLYTWNLRAPVNSHRYVKLMVSQVIFSRNFGLSILLIYCSVNCIALCRLPCDHGHVAPWWTKDKLDVTDLLFQVFWTPKPSLTSECHGEERAVGDVWSAFAVARWLYNPQCILLVYLHLGVFFVRKLMWNQDMEQNM